MLVGRGFLLPERAGIGFIIIFYEITHGLLPILRKSPEKLFILSVGLQDFDYSEGSICIQVIICMAPPPPKLFHKSPLLQSRFRGFKFGHFIRAHILACDWHSFPFNYLLVKQSWISIISKHKSINGFFFFNLKDCRKVA